MIQANEIAATTTKEEILNNLNTYYTQLKEKEGIEIDSPKVIMDVFNVAFGGNTTLFQLYDALRSNLAKHDPAITNIDVTIGSKRAGDIPHSLASVDKAKAVLGNDPEFNATEGFQEACEWYYNNIK